MNDRMGIWDIQGTWGVGFGSGSYTGLGLNLPFHNLHNCRVACTAHARHSGTSLLSESSDSIEIFPLAAWGRG